MDRAAYEEQLSRLQRLAFGAVASDAERAAAVAELELIQRERAAAEAEREGADAAGPPTAPAVPRAPGVGSSTRPEGEASGTAAAKTLKWALVAGTAALLIGVAVGSQIGTRGAADESSNTVDSTAHELHAALMPIGDTAVPRLYEADPTPADVPQAAYPRDSIAPTDYRLLLTRPDGVSLRVARLHGGADVCAVVTLPSEFTASSCTHNGMFPEAGLRVAVSLPGDEGLVRGTIHPDGTAELTPQQYTPEVRPIAGR
ncbi:hypothetical protein [Agromyces bauzanensis]